jgi:hypothetical protein
LSPGTHEHGEGQAAEQDDEDAADVDDAESVRHRFLESMLQTKLVTEILATFLVNKFISPSFLKLTRK